MSVVTVEHACAILCDEGYIESRQRSGNFVIYRDTDGFAVLPAAESAPPVLPPPPRAREGDFPFSVFARTMRRVLLALWGGGCSSNRRITACPSCGGRIAAYLARSRGILVRPEQIVIGSGAEYLYSLAGAALPRRERFALENPSYEKIRRVYLANGVDCELLRLGPDGIRSDELEPRLRGYSPRHPVQQLSQRRYGLRLKAAANTSAGRGSAAGIIIEDDFDSEFTISTKPEETIFSLEPEGAGRST